LIHFYKRNYERITDDTGRYSESASIFRFRWVDMKKVEV